MPRTSPLRAPATRDQADAYRFGLRRLEAALVRGDPVPLHEQIRTQRRAALAGVALGLLGLCAAALYALLSPSPDWRNEVLVTDTRSGTLYVVDRDVPQLMPVANLAAARLVLAAIGRGADAPGATAASVPDDVLAAAPRAAMAAVPGADGVQPELTVAPSWALCDQSTPDGGSAVTTVIGGAAPAPQAAPEDGVLLADADDTTWLVVNGRRHRVDIGDGALLAAYGLSRVVPRPAGAALLDLLPQGAELATPLVRNRGADAPDGLPGQVGDVLVSRSRGGGAEYFVVLSGGLQRVPEVVAELLRVASGAREPLEVGPEELAGARFRDDLAVSDWPPAAPRLRDPAESPVVCWSWIPGEPTGRVWAGGALPAPAGTTPVALPEADGPGPAVDAVAVGPGGAVRATGAVGAADEEPDDVDREPDPGSDGTLSAPTGSDGAQVRDSGVLDGQAVLVSETGIRYPVADEPTAAALGVMAAEPAPAELLGLLPGGQPLDLAEAVSVVEGLR